MLTKFIIAVMSINTINLITRFVERLAIGGVTSWFYGTVVNRFCGSVVIFQEFVALVSTIFCIVRYLLTTRRDSYIRC